MGAYQPKTGAKCTCKRGVQRDNCPVCEGTGWVVDFAKVRAAMWQLATECIVNDQLGECDEQR
jgi:hypothetical protein